MSDPVRLEITDSAAIVTLDAPPLNIFNLEMRDGLIEAFSAVHQHDGIGAMILQADGAHFSAGADLSEFGTVIWATGFRPNYPWLDDELLDAKGAIRHDGGIMDRAGMYVLGLPFTRRRKSSFLDGVGPDAQDLAAHLGEHLNTTAGHRLRS